MRIKVISSAVLFYLLTFPMQSQADIFCKFKFVSLEFPKIGNCSAMIDALGEFEFGNGCVNTPKDLKNKMKLIGRLTGRWLGHFQDDVTLVIKDGGSPAGFISGIGHLEKAGNERSMLEVSKQVKLVDIEMDLANDKVTTRYPAGIAGRQLSELPYPHGYLFLDLKNGETRINNEFGQFTLRGKCAG